MPRYTDESKDRVDNAQASVQTAKSNLDSRRLTIKDASARLAQQTVVIRDAKRAVETSRTTINASNAAVPVTVRELVTHYEEKELPRKAFSTQRTLEASIRI